MSRGLADGNAVVALENVNRMPVLKSIRIFSLLRNTNALSKKLF